MLPAMVAGNVAEIEKIFICFIFMLYEVLFWLYTLYLCYMFCYNLLYIYMCICFLVLLYISIYILFDFKLVW